MTPAEAWAEADHAFARADALKAKWKEALDSAHDYHRAAFHAYGPRPEKTQPTIEDATGGHR